MLKRQKTGDQQKKTESNADYSAIKNGLHDWRVNKQGKLVLLIVTSPPPVPANRPRAWKEASTHAECRPVKLQQKRDGKIKCHCNALRIEGKQNNRRVNCSQKDYELESDFSTAFHFRLAC